MGWDHGEMPELAEGARLEIVCSDKIGTEGSNPSLSATNHVGFVAAVNLIWFTAPDEVHGITVHGVP